MTPLEATGLQTFYGKSHILHDVGLRVNEGEIVALLGRNGAGKTTLLRIIAGFSKTGRGQVSIFGKDARDAETRRRVGVLGHGISLYDELTATENLVLFGRLYGLSDASKRAIGINEVQRIE